MHFLAIASMVMSIFGAMQGYKAGKQQEELAAQQALLADRNTILAKKELNEQVRRQGDEDKRVRASARARAAASGAELSGSPLSYLNYMEEEQGRQLNWMKTAGASRIRLQNKSDKLRAHAASIQGSNQKWQSLFTGFASAASTGAKFGSFSSGGVSMYNSPGFERR